MVDINKPYKVYLLPSPILLKEVVITGKRYKHNQTIGNTKKKPDAFAKGVAGTTYVRLITTTSYDALLKSLSVYVSDNNANPNIHLRIRIYEHDTLTGLPGNDILRTSVYIQGSPKFKWVKNDLAVHNIIVPHQGLFIGLEWVNEQRTNDNNNTTEGPAIGQTIKDKSVKTLISLYGQNWRSYHLDMMLKVEINKE